MYTLSFVLYIITHCLPLIRQIVLDVKDYVDGHLDVKAEDGAIVVKGKKGPCSFERRFSIPNLSQPDKVAAALSDDGVLTVTAPV